ncbi:hypothetical protein V2J09_012314 [Rumex salicifolius]
MEVSGLLTSLGINMGICVLLFCVYSVLRKQPSNRGVYFARSLAQMRTEVQDPHWFDRFVPSPRWILQAWELTDDEIIRIGGLDAVVFVRALVFSMRIFSIASIICLFLVLPLNYYGKDVQHKHINSESLEVFTIQNVEEGSRWLWGHCLALYVICCSAWILLYYEYKTIAGLRQTHLRESFQNPSFFAVLVRGIPRSAEDDQNTTLTKFFTKYYPASYISHELVYRCGHIVKLMRKAGKMYDIFSANSYPIDCAKCKHCTAGEDPYESDEAKENPDCDYDVQETPSRRKETGAAFVFFRTRYDASIVAQTRQSTNPMLWVTDVAPEPSDVYWSNLCVPYKLFWMRRVGTLMATTAFMIFFLAPVTLVQGLANLNKFQRAFPFLKGLLKKPTVDEVVTGYLPSVILMLFLLVVPPLMMLFSTIEGCISRSRRKKATCLKVLYFNIWNVFFVNLVSGTVLNKLSILSNPRDIPMQLATRAVPALVKFFMTYVLTSGWTSLAVELAQIFPLSVNSIYKLVSREKLGPFDVGFTFPFHTEIPRVLLFGLLGFTFAILAPLILPLLLIYFCLAYFVYRNQILNVYLFEYDTGGQYWPIVHDTTIFSLMLAQIMALGVFAIKVSPVCIGFTVTLIISTILFNEYCRQRFLPIFKDIAAQDIIEMDQRDEASVREDIYAQLKSAYSQEDWVSFTNSTKSGHSPFVSDMSEPGDDPDIIPGIEEQPLWSNSYCSEASEAVEKNIPWTPLNSYTSSSRLRTMERQQCPPVRYGLHELKSTVQGKLVRNAGQSGELLLASAKEVEVETELVDETQEQLPVIYVSDEVEGNKRQHGRSGSAGSNLKFKTRDVTQSISKFYFSDHLLRRFAPLNHAQKMSKKRGLSLEEKREKMLQIFYDSQDFYLLKELEKLGPKKGVISQSVKDVIQSLVDDDLVLKDKVGISIYFWSLPSTAGNQLRSVRQKLDSESQNCKKRFSELQRQCNALKKGREDSDEREEAVSKLKSLEKKYNELKDEIKQYADNDPAAFEAMKKSINVAYSAANRWTDNIFTLRQWCSNNFPQAKEQLESLYTEAGITDDFDYLELPNLGSLGTSSDQIVEGDTKMIANI